MMLIRSVAKEIIYNSLHFAGLTHIARQKQKNKLIILTYHSFTENNSAGLLHAIPISRFEKQIAFLKKNYRIVSLSEGIKQLKNGNSDSMPMAAITVDDGFEDNYSLMFNVAKKHRIPVTIFIATDFINTGRPPWATQIVEILAQTKSSVTEYPVKLSLNSLYKKAEAIQILMKIWKHLPGEERFLFIAELRKHLNVGDANLSKPLIWSQITEMSENDIEFGSHTEYHSILPAVSDSFAMQEISASKTEIEKKLGKPCTLFSYPKGNWDERTREFVINAGYSAAVTQQCGMNSADFHPHNLKRIEVPYNETLGTFACRTSLLAIHGKAA